MPNVLGNYNVIMFAQDALITVKKVLGMAGRVNTRISDERRSFQLGDEVRVRGAGTFTAQDFGSSAQDVVTRKLSLTLNRHKEVKFGFTSTDLAYGGKSLILDHLSNAAYAIVDEFDQYLWSLYKKVPWYVTSSGAADVSDLTALNRAMNDLKIPKFNRRLGLHSTLVEKYLNLAQFTAAYQNSDANQTVRDGAIEGRPKFGFDMFETQNAPSHTAGAITVTSGTFAGTGTKGDATVVLACAGVSGTFKAGDTFVLAGNTQRYAVTADATVGSNTVTVAISPVLAQDYSAAAATLLQTSKDESLAFHPNAFALVLAPLPMFEEMGGDRGAQYATVTDQESGVSLRARTWINHDTAMEMFAIDVLYGADVLDPNLAMRLRS